MFCFVQVFWIFASFLKIAPMHVNNVREVPEYEIDPAELDFSNGNDLSKVCIYVFPFLLHETFQIGYL